MEKLTIFERLNNWAQRSVTLKLLAIGFLILVLLIPSGMLTSLITERENMRDATIEEVSSKWGGSQTVGGPVLTIPYKSYLKDEKGKVETTIRYAHFLPDQLTITGKLEPEKRYRGIYVVVLYNTQLRIQGHFSAPKLEELNIPPGDFLPEDAFISLGLSDLKGIKESIPFRVNDSLYAFNPGIASHDIFRSGVSLPVRLTEAPSYQFDFSLNLNGSQHLSFLPLGKETSVTLTSPWSNPSFEGAFLPDERSVNEKGFRAHWKVLQLNRNYPQQGVGPFISGASYSEQEDVVTEIPGHANAADFGVKLLLPIDEYQKTMRSAKYSAMFIILTFLAFFFVEVLNRRRVHPIQYLLVGFAICLFYVLLLSLSEHISFDYAYLIGCLSILFLITFYAWSIFRNRTLTLLIGGTQAILYGFFYSLLQLQDYALLMGSLGLLLILGTIMYLTRNIDWYDLQSADRPKVEPSAH